MSGKKKVLIIFGTRPEAIKMAPLVLKFNEHKDRFVCRVCVTAQHREMLDQVLSFFEICPDYDLNLMKPHQNLFNLTSDIITGLKKVFDDFKPDYTFVHGDTTTSMAGALASFYSSCSVCHVEAGLRTNNKYSPFPEEMNRQITSRLTDYHFVPTKGAMNNLINEGINKSKILITGNTVIDSLYLAKRKLLTFEDNDIFLLKKILDSNKRLVLVTGHRRENFGNGFLQICEALSQIAQRTDVQIVYPVHMNPNVRKPVMELLGGRPNINLIEPISYPAFIWLMEKSKIILTDSGGIQEEAPSLGKPVLLLRNTTERPEAVEAGTVLVVGTDTKKIVNECFDLLDNSEKYIEMSLLHNPYGDGKASERIVEYFYKLN